MQACLFLAILDAIVLKTQFVSPSDGCISIHLYSSHTITNILQCVSISCVEFYNASTHTCSISVDALLWDQFAVCK